MFTRKPLSAFLVAVSFIFVPLSTRTFAQASRENLMEEQAESSEQSVLMDRLFKAVNLNAAKKQDLLELPGITRDLAEKIIAYRVKIGFYKDPEQLLAIDGVTDLIFGDIVEFIYAKQMPEVQPVLSKFSLRTRISNKVKFRAEPLKTYNRMRFQLLGLVDGGFLAEKDVGEKRVDDLRLFYLEFKKQKLHGIVGNYLLEFGQGLGMWGPYGFSKSAEATFALRKKGKGIGKYQSVDENAGLFGGAFAYRLSHFSLYAFSSRNQLDATPGTDDSVEGISTNTVHIDSADFERKNNLTETLLGARVELSRNQTFKLGITAHTYAFDKVIANSNLERNRFNFRGANNHIFASDWSYTREDFRIFGEIARSKSGGLAFINGVSFKQKRVKMAFLYRDYSRDFHNLHGFGFGDSNGATRNERGYYSGLAIQLSDDTTIKSYFDIFSSHWRSFSEPLPPSGDDFSLQIEHFFNRNLQLTARLKSKLKPDLAINPGQPPHDNKDIIQKRRSLLRIQFDMRVSNQVKLRSRVEKIYLHSSDLTGSSGHKQEEGFLIYQDLKCRPTKWFQLTGRITFFKTDSFGSRVFQFENDLPGVLTNRMLYGDGAHFYLLATCRFPFGLAFHTKYSESVSRQKQISTQRNKKMSVQIDFKLE